MHYNFARLHMSLSRSAARFGRNRRAFACGFLPMRRAFTCRYPVQNQLRTYLEGKQTPAMAAGVADHKWTVAEIVALLDNGATGNSN